MPDLVLMVEDSRSFAATVSTAIREAHGYEVLVAYDFEQAEMLVKEHRDDIFVAITDLNLPDAQDGAAAELMANEGIPCIAFTGNYSDSLREMVHSIGVADYVLKKDRHDIDYVVGMVRQLWLNRKTHVLVVDDQSSARAYLKVLLERQCYQVTEAASGAEALRLLEGSDFRMVMIDIVMEGMDGFELLNQIRRSVDVSKMAIIGFSGNASPENIARFIKHGGNDFLAKPFEPEQVTCRLNTNAQLLERFDRLNQLNEQKNELLGMAAHDIRGPLGVILSGASLLKPEVSSDRGNLLVSMMSEAAEQMESLLDGLLDISAIQDATISINKEKVLLSELVEHAARMSELMVNDKSQKLTLSIPPDKVWVNVDRLRMQEVLHNLISNAVKYSPRGGTFELCLSSNHEQARVQVIDEAGGIPESERHLLFKPFAKVSTKPSDGERSTGLGLSICHRIVDLHKGTLRYKENANVGSVFEIQLPLWREQA